MNYASYVAIESLINLIRIYEILILARVLLSWIIRDPENPFYRFLYTITEPLLAPLRRIIPGGMLDLSPIVAYLLLQIVVQILRYIT